MDINFMISSHKDYYKKTLPVLLPSLFSNGIPKENIYCFIGGYYENKEIENEFGIKTYEVDHNSFDHNALISVFEMRLYSRANYWFLLHDTCIAGPEFYDNIKKFNQRRDAVWKLVEWGTACNMGIFSKLFFERMEIGLDKRYDVNIKQFVHFQKGRLFKNTDYTEEGLQKYKHFLIDTENYFVELGSFIGNRRVVLHNHKFETVYGTDTKRTVEYYEGVDLYKIKANSERKLEYELNL